MHGKTFTEIKLTPEEIQIVQSIRGVEWGKLTVIKKNGKVVMITPAPDIKISKD